ncbi:MAG: PAS domain-containing protein, partial [Rhizomicrobium sp.]
MANFGVIAMSGMEEQGGRKRFIAVQAAKAGIGACLALAFIALVGRPDIGEIVAIAGLLAPGALALLAFTKISLPALETASLSVFAGLIGYLVALTGGMNSPLVVWFALVPAEAALSGGRPAVLRAAAAAALVLLAVVAVEMFHALPRSRLDLPIWQLYAGSVLAAVIQSAVVAIAAQDRQRVADQAAAEGAAMYRFLADNAMDLITRHSADGRIRFASPSALALLGCAPDALVG